MKKKIKLGLASKVAIKVTIISLVLFYSTITLVMVVQYSLLKNALFEDFSRYAPLYMESLLDSNIIDDDLEAKINENLSFFSFLPFDTSGNRLSDAIIRNNETGEIIVNEYQYIPENSKNEMFDIPEATPISKEVGERFYFLYKVTYKKYSILYAALTSSISEYYGLLLYRWDVILWASILIFFAMGFYFSRLIIKPIQDHNTSLKLYNTNLAHELKTPLSVVRSNLDMLELTKNEKFIASSKEELTHIENIINSLLFLIQKRSSGENYEIKNLSNIIKKSGAKFPQLTIDFDNFHTEIQKEINDLAAEIEEFSARAAVITVFQYDAPIFKPPTNIHLIRKSPFLSTKNLSNSIIRLKKTFLPKNSNKSRKFSIKWIILAIRKDMD